MRAIERIGLLVSLILAAYLSAKLPDGELRIATFVVVATCGVPLLVGFIHDWMEGA